MELRTSFKRADAPKDLIHLARTLDNAEISSEDSDFGQAVKRNYKPFWLTDRKIIMSDETLGAISQLEIQISRHDWNIGSRPLSRPRYGAHGRYFRCPAQRYASQLSPLLLPGFSSDLGSYLPERKLRSRQALVTGLTIIRKRHHQRISLCPADGNHRTQFAAWSCARSHYPESCAIAATGN